MTAGRRAVPPKGLVFPLVMIAVFFTLAAVGWRATGEVFFFVNFAYLGTAIGGGLLLYALLPRARKPQGRRAAQLLVGAYMLVFLGLAAGENMQIEGFWFYLFLGVFQAAVMHYTIAKLVGPAVFGRVWCGWACWTAAVLDLLPFRRSAGRVPGAWGHLRYAHFALSLALTAGLWYGLGYHPQPAEGFRLFRITDAVVWLVAGNAVYYGLGIGLAFALRDNRAFCKLACPITAFLKVGTHLSLVKIAGRAEECSGCRACERACPMDIRISEYVRAGKRVLSSECIFCLTCTTVCPEGILHASLGLDAGVRELLITRSEER